MDEDKRYLGLSPGPSKSREVVACYIDKNNKCVNLNKRQWKENV
jgi:hypothetical protein